MCCVLIGIPYIANIRSKPEFWLLYYLLVAYYYGFIKGVNNLGHPRSNDSNESQFVNKNNVVFSI